MEIYINHDGEQFGPFGIDDINTYLQDGNFSASDLAWHEGLAEWVPVSSLEGVQVPEWGSAEQAESEPVAEPVVSGGSKKKKILIWSGVGVLVSAMIFAAVYFLVPRKGDGDTAKNNPAPSKKKENDPGKGVELPTGNETNSAAKNPAPSKKKGNDPGKGVELPTGNETNSAVMVSYTKDIQPILQGKCVKCHGEDPAPDKIKGKLNLTNREGIEKGGENKDAIKSGKPEESLIVKRVDDEKDPMPPENKGAPLTAEEKAKVKAWILQGAKFD